MRPVDDIVQEMAGLAMILNYEAFAANLTAAIEQDRRDTVEACANGADETAASFRRCRVNPERSEEGEDVAVAIAALIRSLSPKGGQGRGWTNRPCARTQP